MKKINEKQMGTKSRFITAIAVCIMFFSPLLFLGEGSGVRSQNVGINATGATPNTSAMLDVASTTSGMLLPRMNTTERDAITSPATGLMIYNTDCNRMNIYIGSAWKAMSNVGDNLPGAAGTISGTATVCQGQTGVAYTISAVTGASGYVWTYTGTGFSIASGANTNAITADFSVTATAGDLTVYATHACESGTASPVYSIAVDVLALAPVATAATGIAATSFDANWDASAGATTYYIDVDDNSDFSSPLAGYDNLDVGAVLTKSVTGLSCGTPYYYRVRAGNACGAGVNSNSITATPTAAIPGAPTANAATSVTGTGFDANWSTSAGATTYYLDVDDNSDFSSPLAGYDNLDVGAVVTYNVTGLTCGGTNYYYRVRAGNPCGTSGNSGSITVTTGACWSCGDNITFTYRGVQVTYGTVTGQNSTCWLDRNLGASQVATSSTDAASYGDLFQWGRLDDGHQSRTSATTAVLSGSDTPGHGNFITVGSGNPWDWRSPQNPNLWQGVGGTNNPCPTGYRLPTSAELEAERVSWGSNNAAGAFGSPLKLPVAGYRLYGNGSLLGVGSSGVYWSSTVGSPDSYLLSFDSSDAQMYNDHRAFGRSCRCVKD